MNKEHKDWFKYGREYQAYRMLKRANSPLYRLMVQSVWDARKNAHRWLHRGDCTYCQFYAGVGILCDECIHNARSYEPLRDHWTPKEDH